MGRECRNVCTLGLHLIFPISIFMFLKHIFIITIRQYFQIIEETAFLLALPLLKMRTRQCQAHWPNYRISFLISFYLFYSKIHTKKDVWFFLLLKCLCGSQHIKAQNLVVKQCVIVFWKRSQCKKKHISVTDAHPALSIPAYSQHLALILCHTCTHG